jgi:hypothetical protein
MTHMVLATLLLAIGGAAARDDDSIVEQYALECRAKRHTEIAKLYDLLDGVRSARRMSKPDRARLTGELEAKLSKLENPQRPYYAPRELNVWQKPKVGEFGWVHESATIFEVVDKRSLLIDFVTVGERSGRHDNIFWLADVTTTTAGMYDGASTKLDGLYFVSGTKSYDAEVGRATVPVLKRIDLARFEEKFTRKSEMRKWKSSKGEHTTDAILVHVAEGTATLLRSDGKSLDVPLEKLSDGDRQFIRDSLKTR